MYAWAEHMAAAPQGKPKNLENVLPVNLEGLLMNVRNNSVSYCDFYKHLQKYEASW